MDVLIEWVAIYPQIYDILEHINYVPSNTLQRLRLHQPWSKIDYDVWFLYASDEIRETCKVKYYGETKTYGEVFVLENERISQLHRLFVSWTVSERAEHLKNLLFDAGLSNLPLVELGGNVFFNSHVPLPCSLVLTKSTQVNLNRITPYLVQKRPILLAGPEGIGKKFLITQIAAKLGQQIIRIHLSDSTDPKMLIGTYTSPKPGEFEWQPGVLTQAVITGKWILFTNIEHAPSEVLSVLLPLLEKRQLVIPSRGETIYAKGSFQMFATSSMKTKILGQRLWQILDLAYQPDECVEVVSTLYPVLSIICPTLYSVYKDIFDLFSQRSFLATSKIYRRLCLRDFYKFIKRVAFLYHKFMIPSDHVVISQELQDAVFKEAIDMFGAFIPSRDGFDLVVRNVAIELNIPPEKALQLRSSIPVFQNLEHNINIGRCSLKKLSTIRSCSTNSYAFTSSSLGLLEQLAAGVQTNEPLLLVGETGTGKTTTIQLLAGLLGQKVTVINMSQQTESSDMLGGYKPINASTLGLPLHERFIDIFEQTFSSKKNAKFISMASTSARRFRWKTCLKIWKEACKLSKTVLDGQQPLSNPQKRQKRLSNQVELRNQWAKFEKEVEDFEKVLTGGSNGFMFSFVEGALVKAVRSGHWVLLDEINLASLETLEPIGQLLSSYESGILLSERGDITPITPHKNFRLFGCMNPSTDVGKRELEPSFRSRFTEIYVHSPDQNLDDLLSIIQKYIGSLCIGNEHVIREIAELYQVAKSLSLDGSLVDGAGQRPHYTVRTLSRTLSYVTEIAPIYGLRRSLYEGFCMSFLTLLDHTSESLLYNHVVRFTLGELNRDQQNAILKQIPKVPDHSSYIAFCHYWLRRGSFPVEEQEHYIITPFVQKNLLNIARACSTRMFPILIQGPTSSGKTSMIEYVAKKTGHKFVRINNHEHTDLQEYIGTYVTDDKGSLSFREGVLVEALRNGYWIVLDELNLAPIDVLEALNRLLDDNRELFIPETQVLVKPHPEFMLFATQNPPGVYAGRKHLSRAFRNRFLEIHFDDIPENELETILHKRCKIAPSYAAKIVQVFRELSLRRQTTRIFEQKNSFATLRDLFRWAFREAVGYQQLAENGYMLLAERARDQKDKLAVQEVIEKVMKVKIDIDGIYNLDSMEIFQDMSLKEGPLSKVVWTRPMIRLFCLVWRCLLAKEPVLLVGDTGCGKTTVCQILAECLHKELHIINAHQDTENGDIIGAQRPVRNRSAINYSLHSQLCEKFNVQESLDSIDDLIEKFEKLSSSEKNDNLSNLIERQIIKYRSLFEWHDGALVTAMKQGDFFLLDEISLADDSVLERLNSVLELSRTLTLVEHSNAAVSLTAKDGFAFFATMNPGGDYGKKELSPALRNRFTEIWVPPMVDTEDILKIVEGKLHNNKIELARPLVEYAKWHANEYLYTDVISIRDVLSAVEFINACEILDLNLVLFNAVSMVFIDALGSFTTFSLSNNLASLHAERQRCFAKLNELAGSNIMASKSADISIKFSDSSFFIGDFGIPLGDSVESDSTYSLHTDTTLMNASKVLRALQVLKPILLEGSPGVGKTSLITALARETGHQLVRINLSDQTDLMDLFGSDVPVEGGEGGQFAWRDAPFLAAMRNGHWVLLDELNLASQSVLEGLNACLDHRNEAYIPELDKVFKAHPNFRVFAAQNPQHQGGGRKGLPRSFINRFSVVYVEALKEKDMIEIAACNYHQVNEDWRLKIIKFMFRLQDNIEKDISFGSFGSPWEFNLRDTLRWLQLLNDAPKYTCVSPADYLEVMVLHRMRTVEDRVRTCKLFKEVFDIDYEPRTIGFSLSSQCFKVGHSLLIRDAERQKTLLDSQNILQSQLPVLESVITCINKKWPCILVGDTATGKTCILRLLAAIAGAKIKEMAVNSDTDTMDLIGEYEQIDISRKASELFTDLSQQLLNIVIKYRNFDNIFRETSLYTLTTTSFKTHSQAFTLLQKVVDQLDQLKIHETLVHSLGDIHEKARKLLAEFSGSPVGRFEWFDGYLLKAVEEGHWFVLDNANLCSPAVLDRLNSLLEHKGVLIVNEKTTEDGHPKTIKPHPNFRLFLTVNPVYGELSRAMRNRGVEIFLLKEALTEIDKKQMSLLEPAPISSAVDTLASNISYIKYVFETMGKIEIDGNYMYIAHAIILALFSPRQLKLLRKVLLTNPQFSLSIKADTELLLTFKNLVQKIYCADYFNHMDLKASRFMDIYEYPVQLREVVGLIQTINDFQSVILTSHLELPETYASGLLFVSAHEILDLTEEVNRLAVSTSNSTYLLKSASAVYHNVSSFKGSTPSLWNLLNQFSKFLIEIASANSNIVYKLSYDVIRHFLKLVVLWKNIYVWTNVPDCDISRFYCYTKMLGEWMFTLTEKTKLLESFLPKDSLEKFSELQNLSTGLHMQAIWDKWHAFVPRTYDQWSLWNTVDKLLTQYVNANIPSISMETTAYEVVETSLSLLNKVLVENEVGDIYSYLKILGKGVNELKSSKQVILPENLVNLFNYLASLDLLHIFIKYTTSSFFLTDDFVRFIRVCFHSRISGNLLTLLHGISFDSTKAVAPVLTYFDFCSLTTGNILGRIALAFTSIDENANLESANIFEHARLALLRHFMDHSSLLAEDSSTKMNLILLQRYAVIISIFLDQGKCEKANDLITKLSLPYEELAENFVSILEACKAFLVANSEFISYTYTERFIHSLRFLKDSWLSSNQQEMLKNQGMAYIYFASGMLLVYVPDKPFDPALLPLLTVESLRHYLESLYKESQILEIAESLNSGKVNSVMRRLVSTEISNTPNIDSSFSTVYRSLNESIVPLYSELEFFMKSVVLNQYIFELAMRLSKESNIAVVEEAKSFVTKWKAYIERIREAYPQFVDVYELILSFISFMIYGIELLMFEAKRRLDERSQILSTLILTLVDPSSFARSLSFDDVSNLIEQIKVLDLNDSIRFEIYLFLASRLCSEKQHSSDTHSLANSFVLLANEFYIHNAKIKQKELEEIEEKNRLYRQREFNFDKNDYLKVFINYDDEVEPEVEPEVVIERKRFLQLQFAFWSLYNGIYSEKMNVIPLEQLMNTGSYLAKKIKVKNPDMIASSGFDIVSVVLMMGVKSTNETQYWTPPVYNFYSDPNPSKAIEVRDLIKIVESRAISLIKNWPENFVLRGLKDAIDAILNLSPFSPIAEYLSKLERVFHLLSEWEKLASREYSLANEMDLIKKKIIDWRKFELSNWNNLLKLEEYKLSERVYPRLYSILQFIILKPFFENSKFTKQNLCESASIIVQFITDLTVGEFQLCLKCLLSFSQHAASLRICHGIDAMLLNIYHYFEQFLSKVSEAIHTQKQSLENSIKERILLMSWKDTNVYALKESAKKSHAELFKVLHRYREVLRQPVSSYLSQKHDWDSLLDTENNSAMWVAKKVNLSPSYIEKMDTEIMKLVPVRFSNTPTTLRLMWTLFANVEKPGSTFTNMVSNLITDARELMKLTPETINDDNLSEIKHLKSRKHLLLTETFKTLKAFGLQYRVKAGIEENLSNLRNLLAVIPTFPVTSLSIEKVDRSLMKSLDFIPKFQTLAGHQHNDLSVPEVQKGVGLFNSMLSLQLGERAQLVEFTNELMALKNVYSEVGVNGSPLEFFNNSSFNEVSSLGYDHDFENRAQAVSMLCQIYAIVIQKHSSISPTASFQSIGHELSRFADLLSNKLFPSSIPLYASADKVSSIRDQQKGINDLIEYCRKKRTELPELSYCFKHLVSLQSLKSISRTQVDLTNDEFLNLMNFVLNLFDSLLSSIETATKNMRTFKELAETSSFIEMSSCFSKVLRAFNLKFQSMKLSSLKEKLRSSSVDKMSCQLLMLFLPVCEQFINLAESVLDYFINVHNSNLDSLSKISTLFFMIANNGFCSPDLPQEGKSNSGELESGTGLGSGVGAEDITNTLNEDDDLEELANEEDTANQSDLDESEARELESDMNGVTKDSVVSENENSDSEEENQDLDEEVNDNPEDLSNSLNEKLWDEPNEEDLLETEQKSNEQSAANNESDLVSKEDDNKALEDKDRQEKEDEEEMSDDVGIDDEIQPDIQENNSQPPPENEDHLDLPEDLKLDEKEGDVSNDSDLEDMDMEAADENKEEADAEKDEPMQDFEDPLEENNTLDEDIQQDDFSDLAEDDEKMNEDGFEENVQENEESTEDGVKSDEELEQGEVPEDQAIDTHPEMDAKSTFASAEADEENTDKGIVGENEELGEEDGAAESGVRGNGTADGEFSSAEQVQKGEDTSTPKEAMSEADRQYQSLGDHLREWQQANRIHEWEDLTESQSQAFDDSEFMHVKEDEEEDLQALGNAEKDQIKSIDRDESANQNPDSMNSTNIAEDEADEVGDKQLQDGQDISDIKQTGEDTPPTEFGSINQSEKVFELSEDEDIEDELPDYNVKITNLPAAMPIDEARDLWNKHEDSTKQLSIELCEQLRLILEPTLATKMQGDFRTGKRLNMKRIIPYIASQFKKDKIWMRRVKPSKRTYQVMISIDDSKSMSESGSTVLALETLALVTKALSLLEVGQIAVMKFGEQPELLHPFDKQFSSESGVQMFSHFTFEQSNTNVLALADASMKFFNYANTASHHRSNSDIRQLEIIISDGICEDHDSIRKLLRRAQEEKVMIVFVILDNVNTQKKSSILDIKKVYYDTKEDGTMDLKIQPYIDEFAFDYYLVVRNIEELPQLLSSALRQWFQQMSNT
ncbi:Midasin [Schizosaccharomyces pombe]